MSDIFQEVDEELREEKYKTIWQRYKYYIIAIIGLFIFSVGFNAFWKQYSLNEVNERSARFFSAMEIAQEDKTSAVLILEEFASKEKSSSEYHSMIARFSEAAIRRSDKDFSGALIIYEKLSVIIFQFFIKIMQSYLLLKC